MDIGKRTFLKKATLATASLSLPHWLLASADTDPFVLSNQGCGRATGYAEANKIVSTGNMMHVAWLDSAGEGFSVCVRSYDHRTQTWSPTVVVGDGHDNHGGPALTMDSEGYLHIVYFPHHHAMRYRCSTLPNDSSEWEPETSFGERLTYPTLVCGPDDTLYCTCRRSYEHKPWQVELWKKAKDSEWVQVTTLLSSRHLGYAHFQESLCWSPLDQSLHLACRYHEKSDGKAYGRLQAIGYLRSNDFGETWTSWKGSKISLPATADDLQPLVQGGLEVGRVLRAGHIGVSNVGLPHIAYSLEIDGKGEAFLARPDDQGEWHSISLKSFLPDAYRNWSMIMPGGIVFDQKNRMYIVAQIHQAGSAQSWGHPTNEIVRLRGDAKGEDFDCSLLSNSNAGIPHWLPSMERPTGHNFIQGAPAVAFTAGKAGKGNSDILSNDVLIVLDSL